MAPPQLDHGRHVSRFKHWTAAELAHDRAARELGERQGALAEERYHQLRAAVQGDFALVQNVPPDLARGQLFPRAGLVFDKYTPRALAPVLGVKLHPRADGTVHPGDLAQYVRGFRDNWKTREGGILYCMGEAREFWNMVLNYHSAAGTTGYKPWDRLFERFKRSGFDRGMIPCMFFAREAGCLNPQCPFLHDREACERDRARVLAKRRVQLGKPSMRELGLLEKRALNEYRASKAADAPQDTDEALAVTLFKDDDEDEEVDPEVYKIFEDSRKVRRICGNPECLRTRTKQGEDIKMLQCSKCQVATYCSAECQKVDWKRHKKMPCKPIEILLEDDNLWNPLGTLKGTERIPVNWGDS
ncbi:zinc finger MYND domain-containing protein [Phanerochaete sordida]|uniref:Zinc finger MYND domain-containing protein n=1 Tax=Phanerochaete sordida TaxID=48140 RepID=A0A9P3GCT3_9APHY|nr:zinc finger MYND domain-containing protein [Phanerochaete sordida]